MTKTDVPQDHLHRYSELCINLAKRHPVKGVDPEAGMKPTDWDTRLVLDRPDPDAEGNAWSPAWRIIIHDCSEDGYGWSVMGWYSDQGDSMQLEAALSFGGDQTELAMFWQRDKGFIYP